MKILQSGYVAFGYVMAKELRKRGIESDLLVPKQFMEGKDEISNNPLSLDEELTDSLPEWVITYDLKKKGWQYTVLRTMRKYDLIHANMELPIFAMMSGKPYIAQSIGDDLRELAFKKSVKGFLLQRAYKKSDAFVFSWPPHKPFVKKLGLKNSEYIPWAWDTSKFSKTKKKNTHDKVLQIFHPLAQNWEMKGNDKFLKAFVKLCKEKENIFLYFVDWGKDSSKARSMLASPEVKERIEIIPGPISRNKMIEYMSKSDILADQFNSGSFTRTGMEALVFGIPLLVNLDISLHESLHDGYPPVINAKDDEIYTKLKNLLNSKEKLFEIGEKAKKWALNEYNMNKIIEKYITIYEKIGKK
jgi:glycosyltransferase involved in cell wall biosynthesis